jgi:hypothetical protein
MGKNTRVVRVGWREGATGGMAVVRDVPAIWLRRSRTFLDTVTRTVFDGLPPDPVIEYLPDRNVK